MRWNNSYNPKKISTWHIHVSRNLFWLETYKAFPLLFDPNLHIARNSGDMAGIDTSSWSQGHCQAEGPLVLEHLNDQYDLSYVD